MVEIIERRFILTLSIDLSSKQEEIIVWLKFIVTNSIRTSLSNSICLSVVY